jgi:hypothetical protein
MKTSEIKTALRPLSQLEVVDAAAKEVRVSGKWINIGAARFGCNAANYDTLHAGLPVPHDYFKKAPRDLTIPLVRHHLDQLGDERVHAVKSAEGALSGLTSGDVEGVNPLVVVEAIEAAFGITAWELYDHNIGVYRFLAITETGVEVRVGDVTKAGIEVVGSVFGKRQLSVAFASFRLICSNGMTKLEHGGRYNRPSGNGGGDGELRDWIAATGAEALEGADDHFHELRHAEATPVTDETITNLRHVFRSENFWGGREVFKRIEEEPPRTLYDLIQHVSYVATHRQHGKGEWGRFQRRRREQAIAGALTTHLDVCDNCHQLVVASNGGNGHAEPEPEVIEGEVVATEPATVSQEASYPFSTQPTVEPQDGDDREVEEPTEQAPGMEPVDVDLTPQKGDALWVGGDPYRIVKIEGGVTSLRAGLGRRGKATHKLTTVDTIERGEDAWHVTGKVTKVRGKRS